MVEKVIFRLHLVQLTNSDRVLLSVVVVSTGWSQIVLDSCLISLSTGILLSGLLDYDVYWPADRSSYFNHSGGRKGHSVVRRWWFVG